MRGETISLYVSSREELVIAVINGAKNLADTGLPWLAMTPVLMREFKDRLEVERLSKYDNRLLYCDMGQLRDP